MGRRGPQKKAGSRHNAKFETTPAADDQDALSLKSVPEPPDRLCEVSTDAWRRLAPLALHLGKLTAADLPALELLCKTVAEFEAAAKIADNPSEAYVYSEKGGIYAHPAVFRKQAAAKQMTALFARFGLTPMDRQTLGVTIAGASQAKKRGLPDFAAARSAPLPPATKPKRGRKS